MHRELHQRWSSQDLNRCSYGIPAGRQQAGPQYYSDSCMWAVCPCLWRASACHGALPHAPLVETGTMPNCPWPREIRRASRITTSSRWRGTRCCTSCEMHVGSVFPSSIAKHKQKSKTKPEGSGGDCAVLGMCVPGSQASCAPTNASLERQQVLLRATTQMWGPDGVLRPSAFHLVLPRLLQHL